MLYNDIEEKIKIAMLSKDTTTKDCLKLVKAKAQAIAKEQHNEEISDVIVIKAASKELKELNQTKDALEKANKTDAENFMQICTKISIVEQFIPQAPSEEDIKKELAKIDFSNCSNFGEKMRLAMSSIENADGKIISQHLRKM